MNEHQMAFRSWIRDLPGCNADDKLEAGDWGTWQEDRRYPSKDGTRMIIVSKRTDGAGKIHWKNEHRPLSRARTVPPSVPPQGGETPD